MLIQGTQIANQILKKLQRQRKEFKKPLKLAVFLVGDNPISLNYIKEKKKIAHQLGIRFQLKQYPEKISSRKLCQEMQNYQRQAQPTGLLVQLPLPPHLPTQRVLNRVQYKRDVDCLSERRIAQVFLRDNPPLLPPTVAAILEIFKKYDINLKNKFIVIVGYGTLVGRPLAATLLKKGATLSIVQKGYQPLKKLTQKADILISATGSPHLIKKNMVKKQAIIIDAGLSVIKDREEEKRLCGDVDFQKIKKKARLITPSAGGVGPITLAMLMKNLFTLATQK